MIHVLAEVITRSLAVVVIKRKKRRYGEIGDYVLAEEAWRP